MHHTTNYRDTFITVAPDCRAKAGLVPPKRARPTASSIVFAMVTSHPYRYTSDDVLFAAYAARHDISRAEQGHERASFFARPQPCLRSSDLTKTYGWGVHHDHNERIALYAVGTREYSTFASGNDLDGNAISIKLAMRARRAP